jgi:lipoprotein NlpD
MKPTPRLALLTLSLGILSACSTETRVAPVIDRPTPSAASLRPRPLPSPAPSADDNKPDARGTYTVRRGDTLLRIALDHGQNYRDLITWNNLSDPNDIKVGQVLKVAPSERTASAGSNTVVTSPIMMPGADKPAPVPKKTTPRRTV